MLRAVPLLDDDGEIVEWVGTVTDVDDYARTQEVLRATTARLAALMRHAPVGFAFIDSAPGLVVLFLALLVVTVLRSIVS